MREITVAGFHFFGKTHRETKRRAIRFLTRTEEGKSISLYESTRRAINRFFLNKPILPR